MTQYWSSLPQIPRFNIARHIKGHIHNVVLGTGNSWLKSLNKSKDITSQIAENMTQSYNAPFSVIKSDKEERSVNLAL
jgi:hypothetical protein